MLLIRTKVKSSNSMEIKPNRSVWEKQDDVKLVKMKTNISLNLSDSSFRLYYGDLKLFLSQCMILREVLDSLLIAFSSKLLKKSFLFYQSGDIDFTLAAYYFNRHWSLIL